MRRDLIERLKRLELRPPPPSRRTTEVTAVDQAEAKRVYDELMLRASTAPPRLPEDPNEAARAYMDFVAGR